MAFENSVHLAGLLGSLRSSRIKATNSFGFIFWVCLTSKLKKMTRLSKAAAKGLRGLVPVPYNKTIPFGPIRQAGECIRIVITLPLSANFCTYFLACDRRTPMSFDK